MKVLATLLLLLALAAPAAARERWRVGMAGTPPFVDQGGVGRPPVGLAVDVWEAAAHVLKVDYDLVPLADYEEALLALERREVDLVIGSLAITADRARRVSLTQPIFRTGLAIVTPPRPTSLLDEAQPFLKTAFAAAFATVLTLLLAVGAVLWIVERRANPQQFPGSWHAGIATGIWLALSTMTTVGYGDRVPVTPLGRTVAGLWMMFSMLFASTLTAGLATTFTLRHFQALEIARPEDLQGRRIAVLRGSFAIPWVERHSGRVLVAASESEAVSFVVHGRADAFVYDEPSLRYFLVKRPHLPVRLAPGVYDEHNFGFAVQRGSPLLHRLDVVLLDMAESGELTRMETQWLGPESSH